MKERVHYIDIAKGLLIVMLCVQHLGVVGRKVDTSALDSHLGGWPLLIVCFFMPAFFFITGYCSNFQKRWSDFLISMSKTLVLPLVFFQVINIILFGWYNGEIEWISPFISAPNTSYWFLTALLFAKILYFLCTKLIKAEGALMSVCLFISLTGILIERLSSLNFLAIHQGLIATVFIALGAYMRKNQVIYQLWMRRSLYVFPWMYIILIMLKRDVPYMTGSINIPLQYSLVFYILSLSGSLVVLKISQKIKGNKALEFIGRMSIVIYCMHYIIMTVTKDMLIDLFQPIDVIRCCLYEAGTLVITIILCMAISVIFNYRPFNWILGQSWPIGHQPKIKDIIE